MLDEITFSLDGSTAEINDPIRGEGSFEKCVKNIKKAKQLGYNINITACISKAMINRDEMGNLYLDRMIKFAEELGIERINFHNLFKTGVPRDYFSGNIDISINDWFNVLEEINTKVENEEYKIPVRIPQSFTTKKEFEKNSSYYGYCSCKIPSRILVHPNGMLRVCSLMIGTPYGIARYYDNKIKWDNSPTNELRAHKFNEDTPCTNQYKRNQFGKFIPLCVSFKPKQDELIWKELEWEKRRIEKANSKIKTVVSFQNKTIKENVINSLKELDFVEVVGTAEDEENTYKKIIDLKPDIVFMQYRYKEINAFEMIKQANNELKLDIPAFNIIDDDVPREGQHEIIKLVGSKMNSVIEKKDPYNILVKDILKEYRDYDFK